MTDKQDIYSTYLNGHLHESELIVALDSIQTKAVKGKGVVYTPWDIVQGMVSLADPSPDMTIVEPSCGHGAFLIGLLYHMRERHNLHGVALYHWFLNKVSCVEVSPHSVAELKNILTAYFFKHYNVPVEPGSFKNIHCQDGLLFSNGQKFDLCIGNPPYIRAKHLTSEYLSFLKKTFQSCKKGTIDIYFAFIEKYTNEATQLVFITPNSFLTSNSGQTLRDIISGPSTLLVDFKDKRVFKDASVYTCILQTNQDRCDDDILYGSELSKLSPTNKSQIFRAAADTSNPSIFQEVLSGIATLCDKAYLVKKGLDGKYYAQHDNTLNEVEEGIVAPYLKITKIKNGNLSGIDYMIYPYDEAQNILSEEYIQRHYPLTYNHLLLVRNKLAQRDKGKTNKYEAWYAYGRRQGLHQIKSDEVVIIPQMIGGGCKPQVINITNLLSRYKNIVFTSGFVIPKTNQNQKACDVVFSDEFNAFVENNGRAWPGPDSSRPYYSITAKQLKSFSG